MLLATILTAGCMIALALLHALAAKYFTVKIVNGKRPINAEYQPHATVILSIRGCDPSLEKNLVSLLNQDYSNYSILAVVDHQSDAGWSVVHHIKSEFDTRNRLNIVELKSPSNLCSLKCSALIQAMGELHEDTEVVVLVDADVTPPTTWLAQAVSPLADPSVGVVTGNQWFEPQDDSAASLLRSLWNAGALVPTAFLANPWAGTCAMRVSDVRKARLVDVWKQSIVDDGPLRRAMAPFGLKIVFNPELIMVNRENCTTQYTHRYVTRMLTWSRIHERTFVNTFIHMVLQVGAAIGLLGVAVVALFQANWAILGFAIAAYALNALINLWSYCVVRGGVAKVDLRRDEILGDLSWSRALKLLVRIPVCQILYGYWMISSVLVNRVHWRQITYEVRAHDDVRMIHYRPLQAETPAATSEVSI